MAFLALTNGLAGTVLLHDDVVAGTYRSFDEATSAVPGAVVDSIDIAGMTALPGMVDCHVHLFLSGRIDAMTNRGSDTDDAAANAAAHLRAGVTTVRDLGAPTPDVFEVRDALAGPRVLAAGPIVTIPDGHGCFYGEIASSGQELVEAMYRLADQGVDCVKIAVSGGVSTPTSDLFAVQYSEPDLRAGVEAAHALGLRVAAHASNPEAIRIAAEAGIDSVEHAIMIDDAALEALVRNDTTLVPTLAATNKPPEFLTDDRIPEFIREKGKITLPAHRASITRAVSAGLTFACGTDAGTTDVRHGLAAVEAEQLVGCGLSNADAIAAVTGNAAELLGLGDRIGTLDEGKLADIVVVAGNPFDDITALEDVRLVIKAGTVVHRVAHDSE